jgi:hypothetical protein
MYQWGAPHAGAPAGQMLLVPSINWNLFQNTPAGSGSVQFCYQLPTYSTKQTGVTSQNALGLITPVNDYPANNPNSFGQLTFTYALPHNRMSVVLGQYPLGNFDSNQYAGTQWINFMSYPLAQNATTTYGNASLGSYAQINPTKELSFAAGFQDANNLTGQRIQANTFGAGPWSWFGYLQWSPKFRGLGSGQFTVLYYDWPAVQGQPWTRGWSFNGAQNLNNTWGLFVRANYANGYTTRISTSVAGGVVMNNPLGRTKLDQIGLGVAWDQAARPPINPQSARNEWVVEAYWAWTFFRGLFQFTPGLQFYIDPALNQDRHTALVGTLRGTIAF